LAFALSSRIGIQLIQVRSICLRLANLLFTTVLGCSMTSGDGPPQGSVVHLMDGTNTMPQQGTQAQAALILTIVFLVIGFFSGGLGFLLSPISLILANKSIQITKASPGHPDHGIARAAQIISWIMVGLLLLGIVLLGLLVFILSGLPKFRYF